MTRRQEYKEGLCEVTPTASTKTAVKFAEFLFPGSFSLPHAVEVKDDK